MWLPPPLILPANPAPTAETEVARPRSRLLYRLATFLVRVLLAIFFRRLEQDGVEKVPVDSPVLFAANHPNELLDPFLVGCFYRGKVNFLAKSTLFAFPPVAWLLRALGVIPVYRQRDASSEMSKNEETFRECFLVLERGEALGIFPEGTTHAGPSLLPLKTGAARIALGAEARNQFALGVRIVPVGLNFLERDVFRSDAVALYGEAIDAQAYRERYEADPQQAVRDLTADIERGLRSLTVNLKEKEEELLLEKVKDIFKHELKDYVPGKSASDELMMTRHITAAYYRMLERDPERVRTLSRRIWGYLRLLREARIRPHVQDMTAWSACRYLTRVVPLGVLGLPVALHGAFHNWLAYRIPGLYTDWTQLAEEEIATFKLAVGMITFPLLYALQTAAVWYAFGGPIATIYLATLPATGLFALGYFEYARVFMLGMRSFFAFLTDFDFSRRLGALRHEIRGELAAIADDYLADSADAP